MISASGCVFLGPTLSVAAAKTILPHARYLPPVQGGDLLRILPSHPAFIAIIDGTFATTAAVWHKEILYCLERQIPVYGASSMGALRAAELADYGMLGIGEVYQAYRDGKLNDDDEVALLHTPGPDYRALTEPMVNIRATVEQAATVGILSLPQADIVVRVAKQLFYMQRTWHTVATATRVCMGADTLTTFWQWVKQYGGVDTKCADARALLQALHHSFSKEGQRRRRRGDCFSATPQTLYLRALLRDIHWAEPCIQSALTHRNPSEAYVLTVLQVVVSELAKAKPMIFHSQAYKELFSIRDEDSTMQRYVHYFFLLYAWENVSSAVLSRIVKLWKVVEREITERHLTPRDTVIQQYSVQFRRQHQLLTVAALQAWLDTQGLSLQDYHRMLTFAAHFSYFILQGHLDSLGIFL